MKNQLIALAIAIALVAIGFGMDRGPRTVTHEQMHDGEVTAIAPAHASVEIRK